MADQAHSFYFADYLIFAVTIVISLSIGIYYAFSGGKQRTTSEYFVGNRQMAILPVAISLLVSFESSIMMLGTPAEIYVYGLQWMMANVAFLLANLFSILVAVPLVHPLKITSAYEYLEMRFSSHRVRILGTVLGVLNYTCYMGIVLFGPAIALEAVTGFPQWTSIVSIAVASVIYTAIGGLKAVIWTDVFQFLVMFSGFFAVLIKGTIEIGGIGKTWDIAYRKGRVNMFNFDPDPTVRHTFWNLFFGSLIRGFGLVFNQSSIQRIGSTPTVAAARKVLFLLTPAFFISLSLAAIEGVIAYAYYDIKGCDPLASKQIKNPNQIIPFMVMDIFEGLPGLPGLFMASLFSASLSTLSSGLSSLSALFWTDLVKPHVKPMSELRATIISKLSVIAFGGLAIAVAFIIGTVGGTLIQITGSLLSAIGGPLTGLFMFGAFCPWGNETGAFYGTIGSFVGTLFFCMGQMMTPGAVKNTKLPSAPIDNCPVDNSTMAAYYGNITLYNTTAMYDYTTTTLLAGSDDVPEPTGFSRIFMISYMWYGAIGIIQTFLYGTIISFLTGRKLPGEVERRFVIPFWDTLFPFAPECILKVLRCGYEYPNEDKQDPDLTGYRNMGDKRNADIETVIPIVDKPPTSALGKTNGVMVFDGDSLDTSKNGTGGTAPANGSMFVGGNKGGEVTKSVDNMAVINHGLVPDIEFEVQKGGSDLGSNEFIVMDTIGDNRRIRIRAKSMEFDVPPVE